MLEQGGFAHGDDVMCYKALYDTNREGSRKGLGNCWNMTQTFPRERLVRDPDEDGWVSEREGSPCCGWGVVAISAMAKLSQSLPSSEGGASQNEDRETEIKGASSDYVMCATPSLSSTNPQLALFHPPDIVPTQASLRKMLAILLLLILLILRSARAIPSKALSQANSCRPFRTTFSADSDSFDHAFTVLGDRSSAPIGSSGLQLHLSRPTGDIKKLDGVNDRVAEGATVNSTFSLLYATRLT